MNRLSKNLLIALVLLAPLPAVADFESAEASYRSGQHATAAAEYQAAADTGDIRAFGKLAALYLYGVGVERDYIKAYYWFGLAAKEGEREAERFQRAASSAMTLAEVEQAENMIQERLEKSSSGN